MSELVSVSLLFLSSLLFSCTGATTVGLPSSRNIARLSASAEPDTAGLPALNKSILQLCATEGPLLAASYRETVCTQFLEKVLERHTPLTKLDRKRVNVVLEQPLMDAFAAQATGLQGVAHALVKAGKGEIITDPTQVLPGDLVQFWYYWPGYMPQGHAAVVRAYSPDRRVMEVYSSAASTGGFGIQNYYVPEHIYFVRLTKGKIAKTAPALALNRGV